MVDIVGSLTLGKVWDLTVAQHADRTFLVFLNQAGQRSEYTYRQFGDTVTRTALGLRALEIGRGTVVVMQLENSPEFIACLLALAKVGAIAVPLGPKTPPAEALGLIQSCQADWGIVESKDLAAYNQLRLKNGVLPGGVFAPPRLSEEPFTPPPTAPPLVDQPLSSDALAEILFTSGTTSAPKGVMITHANLVYSGHYAIWQTSMRADDRVYTTMPACHSNFQLVALTGVIVAGATLVLAARYRAHCFFEDARREKATITQLTAMMVRTLLLQPPTEQDCDHQIRETLYFMPISDDDKVAFENRFGVRLLNSYGSTESICWVVTDPPQGERRWPAVGRAGLGYEVAIMGAAAEPLGPGQVGEFWVKGIPGRTLMAGYLNNPEATAATLREDGWLRTSDLGYYDDDGWFFFVDRARNVIKRSGENISTGEVEAVLDAHPAVCQSAVIGIPDPLRDQAVKAFIQLVPGALLEAGELQAYCRDRLAPFKVPEVIEFVAELPRTTSMKVAKWCLEPDKSPLVTPQ
ncbi:MAG: AMP-binding protein [Propionibacteriaceae bacterium]|jgi:crotonobetaine/carnitine-CoA ligase|nr:AMP-binding protein [Propionibacteriaceae bacterium]